MSGLPPKLSLSNVIFEIFQNEKLTHKDGSIKLLFYSHVKLTEKQISEMKYPPEYIPLGVYLLEKNDTNLSLISFVLKKDHPFIYGFYFSITDQPELENDDLTKNRHALLLSDSVKLVLDETYIEVYNDINGISSTLSYSSNPFYSALGYPYHGKYYFQYITLSGLPEETITRDLIGLSKNLRNMVDIDQRICIE